MLFFLVWRDVKVRYKQTVFGAAWAIVQPVATMVVFSIFFGKLAGIPSDGVPYPIFNFAAILPWNLFAGGVAIASVCVVNGAHLIRKVYFPRILLPAAGVSVGVVDFAVAFVILIGMMVWFAIWPSWQVLWIPLLLLLTLGSALGVGLWLSAINVYYRDVIYVLPFLLQLWMLATPVAYPTSLIDEPWRSVYALNPMVGVVDGFRWALLGSGPAPGKLIGVSTAVMLALLVSGAFVFRRMEKSFADTV
jgi:lipopolysaccharide transport system permease protein